MIVEVRLGDDEEPRAFRIRRHGSRLQVQSLASGPASGGSGLELDWRRPEPGVYSVLIGDRSYEVSVEERAGHLRIHLAGRTYLARATDARRRRRVEGGGGDGVARITAPIPGRVARVLRAAGTRVRRGDGVIVLEAMKMENELRAPRDGTVTSVEVEEGQGVESGALLATIE